MKAQLHELNSKAKLVKVVQKNASEIINRTHTRARREVRKVPGSKCTSSKS